MHAADNSLALSPSAVARVECPRGVVIAPGRLLRAFPDDRGHARRVSVGMNTLPRVLLPTLLAAALSASAQTSSSTSSTTTTTPSPSPSTPANPPTTAPGAVTTPPPVSAPNAVARPVTRPVIPPTGNPPQTPDGAVNPLAPNLPNPSSAAQTIVDSTTSTPGVANAAALAVEPTNINALAAAGVDVALNPTAALATIRQAPVAHQQTALRTLQTRVDATARALIDLRAQARANGVAGAGSNFDQAAEDIRLREVALRDALSAAGSTSDEAAWRQAQTQIATLYQAYADSVQRARALLQAPPQP